MDTLRCVHVRVCVRSVRVCASLHVSVCVCLRVRVCVCASVCECVYALCLRACVHVVFKRVTSHVQAFQWWELVRGIGIVI